MFGAGTSHGHVTGAGPEGLVEAQWLVGGPPGQGGCPADAVLPPVPHSGLQGADP